MRVKIEEDNEKVIIQNDNDTNVKSAYLITPTFFSNHYKEDKKLNGKFIVSISSEFMGKDKENLNYDMSKAFLDCSAEVVIGFNNIISDRNKADLFVKDFTEKLFTEILFNETSITAGKIFNQSLNIYYPTYINIEYNEEYPILNGNSEGTLTEKNRRIVLENGIITDYWGDGGDISIPEFINGVTVIGIDDEVFKNKKITSVVLPDTIVYIGKYAFANNNMTEIHLPKSATHIGYHAFGTKKDIEYDVDTPYNNDDDDDDDDGYYAIPGFKVYGIDGIVYNDDGETLSGGRTYVNYMNRNCGGTFEFVGDSGYIIPSPDLNGDGIFDENDNQLLKRVFLKMPGYTIVGYNAEPNFSDPAFIVLIDFAYNIFFDLNDIVSHKRSLFEFFGYFPKILEEVA